MKNYIRTILLLTLGVALATACASAQARRNQLAPPQNGGMAAWHQLVPNGQRQVDEKQSQYTWIELDPSGQHTGYCYADAHALNDFDQVVVDWSDPADCNILHASLWDKGKWALLDYQGAPNCAEPATYFTSITNLGFAFGDFWSDCSFNLALGVSARTHQWKILPDIPGLPYNGGFSMSDNGLATGFATNLDFSVWKHWIWDGHKYIFLTFPPNWEVDTAWAGPLFINDWGQIAGEYFDTSVGHERGYVQEGAKITILDVPGNPNGPNGGTAVNGINNLGFALLCAIYDDPNSPYYPTASFLYRQGKFTQLPTPPFNDVNWWFIFNVNDRGDMVGRWWDSNNNIHTFIALRH